MRVKIFLLFALPALGVTFYLLSNVINHLQGAARLLPMLGFGIACGLVGHIVQALYEYDLRDFWVREGLKYDIYSEDKLIGLYKKEGLDELIGMVKYWKKISSTPAVVYVGY